MMLRDEKYRRFLLFICVFLFLVFVMWCSPMCSDDYEFAMQDFETVEDVLSYVLYYGNGRLLGNISAISMVTFPGAAVILKALVVASVVFLLPEVLGLKCVSASLMSFILLMGINADVFGEVYTWTSGFSNYLPPIWLTLVILYLIKAYPAAKNGFVKGLICLTVCVLGVASQLFVEHTTLINIVLSGLLAFGELRSERKERALPACLWLIATLAGAAMMFAIPKIFYIEDNRSTGYRSFHLGSVLALLFSMAKNVMRFSVGYLGAMGIVMCLGSILTVYMTRNERTEKWNTILLGVCGISLCYQLISCFCSAESWYGQLAVVHHAISMFMVIPPFFVWAFAALKLEKALRNRILCILALALISLGVLLVVSPVPARVIYQSYIFIVAAVLLLAAEAAQMLTPAAQKRIRKGLMAAALVLTLVLGCIFLNIHNLLERREQHIADAMSNDMGYVEIFRIPYDYIFWENEFGLKYWYYYQEPGDLEFIVLDFDTWCSKYLSLIVVE